MQVPRHLPGARQGRQLPPRGVEVGGRFGREDAQLLRLSAPARQRAEAVPVHLRPSAINAWVARWSGLLALAGNERMPLRSLGSPPPRSLVTQRDLHEDLADAWWQEDVLASRLPTLSGRAHPSALRCNRMWDRDPLWAVGRRKALGPCRRASKGYWCWARRRLKRETHWQAEPTQQESSQQRGFQVELRRGGPCCEHAGRERSCL